MSIDKIPVIYTRELSPYINVIMQQYPHGVACIVQEVNLDKSCVGISFFIDRNITLSAQSRKDYLEAITRMAVKSIENLFVGCEDADCPQCGGNNVTHL